MGLQRKSCTTVAGELKLPLNQALAIFNKAMRKFSDYFDRVCLSAIEQTMQEVNKNLEDTTISFRPTEVTLEEELKSGELEIRERQKRDRESLFDELGIANVIGGGDNNGKLSQYAIRATDEEWAERTMKLSNAKQIGIVSMKAPKRQVHLVGISP